MTASYRNFNDFYPFYLSEHANRICRRLHFIGTSLGLICFVSAIVSARPALILLGFIFGYAFAWVGHLVFEKNRPATFTYPLYSFIGDWAMWKDILTGKIKF